MAPRPGVPWRVLAFPLFRESANDFSFRMLCVCVGRRRQIAPNSRLDFEAGPSQPVGELSWPKASPAEVPCGKENARLSATCIYDEFLSVRLFSRAHSPKRFGSAWALGFVYLRPCVSVVSEGGRCVFWFRFLFDVSVLPELRSLTRRGLVQRGVVEWYLRPLAEAVDSAFGDQRKRR